MTPFDKLAIRPAAARPQGGKDEPEVKPMPVESVRFSFNGKGNVTLSIADFTSGQAMIDAAQEWAAKQ